MGSMERFNLYSARLMAYSVCLQRLLLGRDEPILGTDRRRYCRKARKVKLNVANRNFRWEY